MKKLLFIAAIFLGLNVNAQITGGTMLTGGNASFSHYRNNDQDYSSTTLALGPQFGLAFADNFVAGAWFSLSSTSWKSAFDNDSYSAWSVGPFVRYYMQNFFLQLGYGYQKFGSADGQSIIDVELGYAMFFNDFVALEPALYYNQYFDNGLDGADLGIKLGFQIYFNR